MRDTETDTERIERINHDLEMLNRQRAELLRLTSEAVGAMPILRTTILDRRRTPRGSP